MSSIGERLREERDRLSLNQTDFGLLGGVSRNSQYKYESNEIAPDAAYLSKLVAASVDVLYVLAGSRTHPMVLPPDEAVLLDNYRNLSSQQQKDNLKTLSSALVEYCKTHQI